MPLKKIVCVITVICIFFAFSMIYTNAFDEKEFIEDIDVQDILNKLPQSAKENLPQELFSSNNVTDIPDNITNETLRNYTLNLLERLFKNILTEFTSLLAIIVLISLINTSKNTLSSESFKKAIEYTTTLVLSIYIYDMITHTSAYIADFMSTLDILINALIPIMATLYSLGGNVSSAIVNSSGMTLTITATNYAVQHIFLPFLKICFGLLLAGKISGIKGINHVKKTLRDLLTTSLIGTTTLFSVFLVFKTNISVASDGLAARTIKFAGSFIPVIGSPLGESVRTVMTGITMIKNSVGFVGIFILIATTLPTILQVVLTKFVFDFSSSLSYVLGNESEGEFLKNISSIFNFLIAVTFTISILFMFELTVFIFISPALGGG